MENFMENTMIILSQAVARDKALIESAPKRSLFVPYFTQLSQN